MLIRIRWKPRVEPGSALRRRWALALGGWTIPASGVALALAMWRLTSDLGVTAGFAISSGLFSRWQVWLALAVLFQIFGSRLNRYGRGDGAAIP